MSRWPPDRAERLRRTRVRFIREVQFRLGCDDDGIPGPQTWGVWIARKIAFRLNDRDYRLVDGDPLVIFIKDVQAAIGAGPDGIPGPITFRAWARHAYPQLINSGVQALPVFHGAKPIASSGFNGPANEGPNFDREYIPANAPITGHIGLDHCYLTADVPEPWRSQYRFKTEPKFCGPPAHVLAMWPGRVVSVSSWSVRIDHGNLPEIGVLYTKSLHHREVLVSKGDIVEADTPIAIMGETRTKGAPHEHREGCRWRPGEQVTWAERAFDLAPITGQLRVVCGSTIE